jgi:integrase
MASIRKRGSSFQVRIKSDGRVIASKSFGSLKDARDWAKQSEATILRDTWDTTSVSRRMTLREALAQYDDELLRGPKKGKGQEHSVIKQWLKRDSLSTLPLSKIKPSEIVKVRDGMLRDGYSPATTVRHLAALSNVFNVAIREWNMTTLVNPVSMVRKPLVRNARSRVLTETEEALLIEAAELHLGGWLKDVVKLALETAMRRSEIARLRWEWVDLGKRVATLPDTKNGTARAVPLTSTAVDLLRGRLPENLDGAPAKGVVFPIQHGDAITGAFATAVRRARASYVEQGLIQGKSLTALDSDRTMIDVRFHDLRHCATTRLFDKGLNVMEVASISGHKTLSMLQRYTHLKAEDLARKLG